jgi:hypothetical protein
MFTPEKTSYYYHLKMDCSKDEIIKRINLINFHLLDNKLIIKKDNDSIIIDAHLFFHKALNPLVFDVKDDNVLNNDIVVNKGGNLDLNWLSCYILHLLSSTNNNTPVKVYSWSKPQTTTKHQGNFIYENAYTKKSFFSIFKEKTLYTKLDEHILNQTPIKFLNSVAPQIYYSELNKIHPLYLTPMHYLLSQKEVGYPSFILTLIEKLNELGYPLFPKATKPENELALLRLNQPILHHALNCNTHVDILIYLINHLPVEEQLDAQFFSHFLEFNSGYSVDDKKKLLHRVDILNVMSRKDCDELVRHLNKTHNLAHFEAIEAMLLNHSMQSSTQTKPHKTHKI